MSATEVTNFEIVNVPDKELVAQFVESGSEPVLEEIIRRYQGLVWSSAYRVLYDRDTAIDCTQETFVIFARNAAKIRDGSQVSGWLFTTSNRIAKRMLHKSCRQKKAERQMLESTKLRLDEQPPEILADRETWQALSEELCQLPDKYRTILLLHFVDNKTHRQVSEAVGIPLGSVSSNISIGLKKLKKRLDRRSIALASVLIGIALKDYCLDPPAAMASNCEMARATLHLANAGRDGCAGVIYSRGHPEENMTNPPRAAILGISGSRAIYLLILLSLLSGLWLGRGILSSSSNKAADRARTISGGQLTSTQTAGGNLFETDAQQRWALSQRVEPRLQQFVCESECQIRHSDD